MSNDNVLGAKEMRALKDAQWEGFRKLAAKLPNHHILAVDLVRTFTDGTAAVFTIVKNGQPIRTVVYGDAQGRVDQKQECRPRRYLSTVVKDSIASVLEARAAIQTPPAPAMEARAAAAAADVPPEEDPNFSLGRPPVTQNPEPGIVALGSSLLASAFNLGEHVDS